MSKKKSRAIRKKEIALAIAKNKVTVTLPKPKDTNPSATSLHQAPDLKVDVAIMMAERMDPTPEPEAEPPIQVVEIAPGRHQFPLFRGSKEFVQADLW